MPLRSCPGRWLFLGGSSLPELSFSNSSLSFCFDTLLQLTKCDSSWHYDIKTLSWHQNPFTWVIFMSNSLFLWILFLFSSCCCQGASLSERPQAKLPRGRTEICWLWAMGRNRVWENGECQPHLIKTCFLYHQASSSREGKTLCCFGEV